MRPFVGFSVLGATLLVALVLLIVPPHQTLSGDSRSCGHTPFSTLVSAVRSSTRHAGECHDAAVHRLVEGGVIVVLGGAVAAVSLWPRRRRTEP